MWFAKKLWYFFLVPGVLLLAGAAFDGYRTWQIEQPIERVQGTVGRTWTSGKLGVTFQADVQFTPRDGRSRTFTTPLSSIHQLQTGRAVTVVFDSDDPDHPRVEFGKAEPWSSTVILACWGGMFTLIGGIPLYFTVKKERLAEWLKLNGREVEAEFTGVHLHSDLIVNGKSPWQVTARWTDLGTKLRHEFKSEYLWKDPSSHVFSKVILVVIDPANPKHYWMNLSFLPRE